MGEFWGLAAAVSNYVDQTLPNSELKHISYYKQASSFDLRGIWISLVASWAKTLLAGRYRNPHEQVRKKLLN